MLPANPTRRAIGAILASVAACLLLIAAPSAWGWRPNTIAARQFASSRPGSASFTITTPAGKTLAYHGGKRRFTASLIKPLLLVAYLRQPEVRDRPLTGYERKRLLGPMIRRSSNQAATEVNEALGSKRIETVIAEARLRDFSYDRAHWGLSRTSSDDQARFFREFAELTPTRHRSYALNLLAAIKPTQRWGIAEVVPQGWRIYFKGGWGVHDSDGALIDHQAALLVSNQNGCTVSLAVMSDGNRLRRTGKQTERGIAKRLFAGLQRLGRRPGACRDTTAGGSAVGPALRP